MARDPEKDQQLSVAAQSTQHLSTRASLVTRGLRDLSVLLNRDSVVSTQDEDIPERPQSADQNSPTIILKMHHWWTEPDYFSPPFTDMKCFNFVCSLRNVSDRKQLLGKENKLFHRSKATGDMVKVADALLLESPPEFTLPLQLWPKSVCEPVILELQWPFPAEKSEGYTQRFGGTLWEQYRSIRFAPFHACTDFSGGRKFSYRAWQGHSHPSHCCRVQSIGATFLPLGDDSATEWNPLPI